MKKQHSTHSNRRTLVAIVVGVLLGLTWTVQAQESVSWLRDTNDTWGKGVNWSSGVVPNQAGLMVDITNVISAGRNINNVTNYTIGYLKIGNSSFTRTLNSSTGIGLTFDTNTSGATSSTLTVVNGGNVTFNTGLNLKNDLNIIHNSNNNLILHRSVNVLSLNAEDDLARVLTVSGTGAGDVIFNGTISGEHLSLVQNSSGVDNLDGPVNTYGGGTTVEAGTLIAATEGALGTGDVTLEDAAVLTLQTANGIADGATLSLFGDGVMNLSFSGTDTIGALYFDGVQQLAGTWGAVGSGAQFTSDFFNGTGTLTVVPEPQTVALATLGLLGMVVMMRRRRTAQR